eukprot:s1177_g11.t1
MTLKYLIDVEQYHSVPMLELRWFSNQMTRIGVTWPTSPNGPSERNWELVKLCTVTDKFLQELELRMGASTMPALLDQVLSAGLKSGAEFEKSGLERCEIQSDSQEEAEHKMPMDSDRPHGGQSR